MKKIWLKRMLVVISTVIFMLGMVSVASAADDIVLEEPGSTFIQTFDPGDGDSYKYMGYVYCYEAGPEYKYLQITYTGDETAFSELRLEFVVNSDPSEEKKLTPCWFAENDEGTIKTVDDTLVPAPSATEQTVVIDLEKSGIDLTTGIRAFHVHDTQGTGSFTITDARLMTSADGSGSSATEETTAEGTDDNKESVTDATVEAVTTAEQTDNDSSNGSNALTIVFFAAGGVVVGLGAYFVSGKIKFK